MPRIPSIEEFSSAVRRSGLVSEADFADALSQHRWAQAGFRDARLLAAELVSRKLLTAWQSSVLLSGLPASFFIEKYRLLSRIGTGGTSTVYLAKHALWDRPCAIKVVNRKRLESAAVLQRFLRESEVTARFDHPHIVKVFDVGEIGDLLYLVMEYVDGPSLQSLVETHGPLPAHAAAEFMAQAAAGLATAHEERFVHRDVKPANLLLTRSAIVKVADLGLARVDGTPEGGPQLTYDQGGMLGTVDYLAPEQALDSHAVDDKADVYSLGCSFYFTLTGTPPFASRTLAQTLLKHQSREPDDVCGKRPDVPRGLAQLITAMMQKAAEDRPSMAETAMLLRGWQERNPAPAEATNWHPLVRAACTPGELSSIAIRGASTLGPLPPADRTFSPPEICGGLDDESSLSLMEASSMWNAPTPPDEAPARSATDTAPPHGAAMETTVTASRAVAFRVHCPSCGKPLRTPPDAVGRRARCPFCKSQFVVPSGPTRPNAGAPRSPDAGRAESRTS